MIRLANLTASISNTIKEGEFRMARALISKNATKSVYRDGDKAVKVFCKGFPKAEVLNEALISARVEAIGGINIPSVLSKKTAAGPLPETTSKERHSQSL